VARATAKSGVISASKAERNCIPVEDSWQLPASRADRGISQLGSLGSGDSQRIEQHRA
jgi:hypothetical protein